MTQPQAYHTRAQCPRQKRGQQAQQRRLQKTRERLQRQQTRAQRALQALERALADVGLPATVVAEVPWRRQAQQPRLGKIFGRMFPPPVWLPQ